MLLSFLLLSFLLLSISFCINNISLLSGIFSSEIDASYCGINNALLILKTSNKLSLDKSLYAFLISDSFFSVVALTKLSLFTISLAFFIASFASSFLYSRFIVAMLLAMYLLPFALTIKYDVAPNTITVTIAGT